ncbi:hypothetical protein BGX28_004811 [Mortierella sp. GBA30]|nr:hypothetical protein BGX28_004811 [Mortierella sp. GBA30]
MSQYLDPTKKRGPPKGAGRYNNAVEDRLHRMETMISGVTDDERSNASDEKGPRPRSSSSASASGRARRRKSPKDSVNKPAQVARRERGAQVISEQQPHPYLQSDHQHPSSPLHEFTLDQKQLQHQHQFQLENPYQLGQQQQRFVQDRFTQQHQPQHQHPNGILDLQLDSSRSPDVISQTYSDDIHPGMETHLLSPMHQDLLKDTSFASFSSPSPILGSDHSIGEYNERSPGADTLPRLGMNTPPTRDLDDLEEDMGHLTLDHKGHERYVGKSSPMFYNRRHWGGYSIREREQPEARKFVENPDLPSPEVMTTLLNLHFTYVHPFAPCFVWSTFLRRLQTRDYSPSFLFLLNSIFALASRFSDDLSLRTDPAKPETAGVRFMEKAKAILDTIYDSPDMYCVGALVLLSYQQMGSGAGYRAWMFIGISIRMAQHLGLNRDCLKLNPLMPALGREERNRIWWTCFVADRLVSATFGRPQGINEHDVDATYPEGIDEENIQLEYKLDGASSILTGPSPHSEKNFVYMASLTRIMGRVMVSLYSPMSQATTMSGSSTPNLAPLKQLDKELTDWLLTLPPHLEFQSVQQEPGTFVCTLHMTFYATLILLHRPYSHQSPLKSPNEPSISLSICTSAANNSIEMANSVMRSSDGSGGNASILKFMHSSTFLLFTAGLVHITNCTSVNPVLAASAKLRTVETLQCLSVLADIWVSAKFCGRTVRHLVKARNIELPCSVEGCNENTRHNDNSMSSLVVAPQGQGDILPGSVSIPKEQSFAFDVDQIMGYYQSPGIRHAEPLGRNSRHFSPTPYFSPISPHHAQSQIPSHPGLTQGHAPLPRRPRQTKNTLGSPMNSGSSSMLTASMPSVSNTGTQGTPAVFSRTATSHPEGSMTGTTSPSGYYPTPLIDSFVTSPSAPVANGVDQQQQQQQQQRAIQLTADGRGVPSNMYQNPYSSTVWNLPTSMDNDEWILYMQNGGAFTSGQIGLNTNGLSMTGKENNSSNKNSTSNNSNNNNNNNNSTVNSSKGKIEDGVFTPVSGHNISPTLLDNNEVNLGAVNTNANSSNTTVNNCLHPLSQSLTRNDLLENAGTSDNRNSNNSGNSGVPDVAIHPQQQQHNHLSQQAQTQPQLLLPSQGAAEYDFFMNNTGRIVPVPVLTSQVTVASQNWNA